MSKMEDLRESRMDLSSDAEDSTTTTILQQPATDTIEKSTNNIGDITTQLLDFVSGASNETLIATAVGLVALTWTILGRIGLILIGAFGGVILHATWEGRQDDATATAARNIRKETSVEVVNRILNLRQKDELEEEKEAILDRLSSASAGEGFEDFKPETANALVQLVEAVVRDYVKWWYGPIVPADESFPSACRKTLTNFIRAVSTTLSRKRPADTFIDFLTNSTSIMVVFLGELHNAVNAPQAKATSTREAIAEYLVTNPESNLANIINIKQQQKKFKMIAEDILEHYLDKTVYACDPSRVFLREILAGVVLEMSLTTCSKPEWLNGWIVYLLEEGAQAISHAIDEGVASTPVKTVIDESSTREDRVKDEKHQNRMLGAEKAMEEAMDEAKRLSRLIAEEEKQKLRIGHDSGDLKIGDALAQLTAKDSALGSSIHDRGRPSSAETDPPGQDESAKNDLSKSEPRRSMPDVLPTVEEGEPMLETAGSDDSGGQATPTTGSGSSSPTPPVHTERNQFTDFDQIVPTVSKTSVESNRSVQAPAILTLHNAAITVHDDSTPGDKGKIRSKPNSDYWIQIEPASSQFQGWMIFRKHGDFETLHEILRRIATISGVAAFLEQHRELPDWRAHTKSSLRGELERYLRDACWYQPLAESEGMKRFLEKDQAQTKEAGKGLGSLGWPTPAAFETMGKGMLDALTAGPKSAAEGTKAAFGGVTGVFGTIGTGLGSLGPKKRDSMPAARPTPIASLVRSNSSHSMKGESTARPSSISYPRTDISPVARSIRTSEESTRSTRSSRIPLDRRSSYISIAEDGTERIIPLSGTRESTRSERSSASNSRDNSRPPSASGLAQAVSPRSALENMVLPPPPSDIPDDYAPADTGRPKSSSSLTSRDLEKRSSSITPSIVSPTRTSTSSVRSQSTSRHTQITASSLLNLSKDPIVNDKEFTPITEAETRVCVELLFATVNELYTLSSAWSLRRALLTTAKTYLIRPGNPSLLNIQSLLQESVLHSMTIDSNVATHLLKLRANTMPTESELALWPKELSVQEKEDLRIKARELLVKQGIPAALVGVMGQAATGEAVGRVFDSLQEERVLRGVMFGLLLQGVRVITQ